MNKQASSLSFMSKLDQSELYELMRVLPSMSFDANLASSSANTMTVGDQQELVNLDGTNVTMQPQHSVALKLENQLTNPGVNNQSFTTLENFPSFSNLGYFSNFGANVVPATSNLPTTEPFAGAYGFKINLQTTQNPKKTVSWTYSKMLNKLYCHPNVPCPVEFNASQIPPAGSIIRATPIYVKFEHIQNVITRCENHKKSKEFDQDSKPNEISHLVRCQHPQSAYETDAVTKRESVIIPFEIPQTGAEWTTALYKFMCFSSCFGGSQKPVKIVFTLEYNGEVLGRSCFEVKICACPGRDRSIDEKRLKKPSMKMADVPRQASPKQALNETLAIEHTPEPGKKKLKESEPQALNTKENSVNDHQLFTLTVKGRKNYEILKHLNEALEIQTIVTRLKRTTSSSFVKQSSANIPQPPPLAIAACEPIPKEAAAMAPPDAPKRKQTLEEFLDAIDMIAYCNVLNSNGVWTLEDLIRCTKKRIDSLKISQSDTAKLWSSLQALKMAEGYQSSMKGQSRQIVTADKRIQQCSIQTTGRTTRSNTVKRKLEDMEQQSLGQLPDNFSFNLNDLSTSFLNSSMFKNDNLLEISKCELKLSILNE